MGYYQGREYADIESISGFSAERIREIFEGAGAGKDFGIEVIRDVVFQGSSMRKTLFMARGTKP